MREEISYESRDYEAVADTPPSKTYYLGENISNTKSVR